ncbi:MAG: anhydro-N-acetylmuramic acid kinase [Kaiparowitsia implicata GSE-PSE-MK54-09C]|nr:anhydro-N-acetylmuramic acid kinase [Kaiparowitsia implicata GSE-PSE-MK54-09C]
MRVVGLISGTSVDGIDAALVDVTGDASRLAVQTVAAATYPYPDALRSHILQVCGGAALALTEFAELDEAIARQFAKAALQVQQGQAPAQLIGSHGQTVFHRPRGATQGADWLVPPPPDDAPRLAPSDPAPRAELAYSLQLGRGDLIAHLTQIPTVSNFRAADIAAGGEGAPMVSGLDVALLRHPTRDRCVQNIGGIGNVTVLPAGDRPNALIQGWDTGPGNSLIDLAVERLSAGALTYDNDGAWARQGKPSLELVAEWLQQPYFRQSPPKSTGRELFGAAYLEQCWQAMAGRSLDPADMLATLTELTAASIAESYRQCLPSLPAEVLLCGGGSRNHYLRQRLQSNLAPAAVLTTDEAGVNADFKEAIAFAVLAYWRFTQTPGNVPAVTGARQAVLLGTLHTEPLLGLAHA